mgnify:CR=1 FL=1
MLDLVERLRAKGRADRERMNHTWRRLHVERMEAAHEIERLRVLDVSGWDI